MKLAGQALWAKAQESDTSLAVHSNEWATLARKRIRAVPYSRERVFSSMAKGRVSLVTRLPVPVQTRSKDLSRLLADRLRHGFLSHVEANVRLGPSRRRASLRVPEVVRRWEEGRSRMCVTDLHFRGTRFEKSVDTKALSHFNLYSLSQHLISELEMMTLVISTQGALTDSHSDDSDGTNHCFVGRKLWLVWDRLEGQRAGLQDVEYDAIIDKAAFDIQTFLGLLSSRWFLVEPGMTLFLPGDLTHKVITLDRYLGLGSFYFSLPCAVRTMQRWILRDPGESTKAQIDRVVRVSLRQVGALRRGAPRTRESWGLKHFESAARGSRTHWSTLANELKADDRFVRLIQAGSS